MNEGDAASALQLGGAFSFGLVMGWYVYYLNRYRSDELRLADAVTLVGAVGGGAVLSLFPAGSDLFGAYGLGLAAGFFGYFAVLVLLVARSEEIGWEWFLDGRRKKLGEGYEIQDGAARTARAMRDDDRRVP